MFSVKMVGEPNHSHATTPYGGNWSVKSWKEAVKLTMVKQEAMFQHQLEELHRIHGRQVKLMEDLERTLIGQSQKQLDSKLDPDEEMVKFNELIEVQVHVGGDMDAPVTPETTNYSMARGTPVLREEECARSAAEALVAMSSSSVPDSSNCLLWFAKIVTSVKRDVSLPSDQHRMRLARRAGPHRKRQAAKRPKGTFVDARIGSWGTIKNGRRSQRVRACDPSYTFERGALLCRWR